MKELYTVIEVASIFKVHPKTVYAWLTKGKIKGIKTPSGSVRIREEEVQRILDQNYLEKR